MKSALDYYRITYYRILIDHYRNYYRTSTA